MERDVSQEELRAASQLLEERVAARTRELQALLDTSKALASTLELRPLLDEILDQLKTLVDCDGASVLLLQDDELTQLAVRRPPSAGPIDQTPVATPARAMTLIWDAIRGGKRVMIPDVRGSSPLAKAYRDQLAVDIERTPLAYVRAFAAVPLIARDRVIGMLAMAHQTPDGFDERDVELAAAVAVQAAVAIENARLFEQTQRQARDMEALSRADAELFRSLNLDSVLQSLVDVAVDVLGADKSAVILHEGEVDVVRAARNYDPLNLVAFNRVLAKMPHVEPAPATQKLEVIRDVAAAPDFLRLGLEAEGILTAAIVPIRDPVRMLGTFGISFVEGHEFSESELRLYQALADRAAVAIKNAELFQRAEQVASLEERQRLARELHDSVSQALYGIALGARTARLRIDEDPATAAEPIDYVTSLAEAGLAEMRALIFELRPESLEVEGLVAAIEKQVASISARYRLDIHMELGEEPACSLDLKEALYRITQEALHNIVKHAQATRAQVRLTSDDSEISLSVADDGRGFDATKTYPGHVGLRSMPERTERLGGTFELESTIGQGTCIRARFSR
jgi:signal transduction histidine kinase